VNVTAVASAELACTTDIETFEGPDGRHGGPARWSNRVTHIFR
jgi:hypothetical protein